MRVHHLNCGTMCPAPARLLEGKGSLFARTRMVCHCLAVELSSGLALVDTGFGTDDVANPARRLGVGFMALVAPVMKQEETALAQLQQLGFRASDVRHVLPTHLDLDHASGIPDFPDATVHILTREYDAANARRTQMERLRYKPRQWAKARFQKHTPDGESWFGFESVRALPGSQDEVLIIPLYGHTRGHAGIAVRTSSGWLLHAGDAYFHHDEVLGQPYSCPITLEAFQRVIQTNGHERVQNRNRLRELAKQHGSEVTIICAHDTGELEALSGKP